MKKRRRISTTTLIFSSLSSAVGLGSIWNFPMKIHEYSWSFAIPFLIALFVCGWPVLWLEINIGNWIRKNHILGFSRFKKRWGSFVGWLQTLTVSILSTFYLVLLSWCLITAFLTIYSSNYENFLSKLNFEKKNNTNKENWLIWTLMGTTFTILFTFFVIRKGMKKGIAKVSNIFVPLFIITLLSISFFILFKNFQGIKSDFKKTDFKKLEEITVWKDAFGQAFFLLSTTTGTIIIYSSHAENKKNNNKKATIIIIATIIICFLIGNIVNNLIGEIATKNKEIKIKGGSKLLFETIPFFFLSGSGEGEKILLKVTGFTFFILVFFIGFTSIIGQIESLVNGIKEKFNFTRFKSLVISCFFVFLVSFIYYKDEKIIKFTADWVASTWLLLLTVFELFIVFRNKKQYYQFKHWINKHDKFKLNKIVEVWIFLVVPYIASVNFLFSYKQITQNFNEDPVIFLVITFFSVIVPVILALLLSKSSKQEHQKSNLLSN